jgi:hypothetical protein
MLANPERVGVHTYRVEDVVYLSPSSQPSIRETEGSAPPAMKPWGSATRRWQGATCQRCPLSFSHGPFLERRSVD